MAANEWSEKKKMIVTIVAGVVVNAVLGGVLYNAYGAAQKKRSELATLQTQLKGLRKDVENGPALEQQLKSLQLDFDTKSKKLPDAQYIDKFIETVSGIAAKHNCEYISSISQTSGGTAKAGAPGDMQGVTLIRDVFQTRWKADFHGWCKLMNELEEKYERFVAFERLTILPQNNGMTDMKTRHDVSVDIVTYRYIKK